MARQDILSDNQNATREELRESTQQSDSQMTVTDDDVMSSQNIQVYHERQSRQLCALHALNNLFQNSRAFDKHDLDLICKTLAPESRILNPHRSALGIGN